MDKYTKVLLTIIAVGVTLIAVRPYLPASTKASPTYGEFLSLRQVQQSALRKEKYQMLLSRLPMVRIQGGQVDADVTGSVQIDR